MTGSYLLLQYKPIVMIDTEQKDFSSFTLSKFYPEISLNTSSDILIRIHIYAFHYTTYFLGIHLLGKVSYIFPITHLHLYKCQQI